MQLGMTAKHLKSIDYGNILYRYQLKKKQRRHGLKNALKNGANTKIKLVINRANNGLTGSLKPTPLRNISKCKLKYRLES